jgi:hypothetical protein
MNVRALKAGLQVAEVPSFEHKRRPGASGSKTIRDGWRVLKVILEERISPFLADARPPPARVSTRKSAWRARCERRRSQSCSGTIGPSAW